MDASERITQQINELSDWRGEMLAQLRELVHEAYPDIGEDWKWETAVSQASSVSKFSISPICWLM